MPTFTGKTFSSFYKNIFGINQSSNTGVDSTTRVVHDGAGQSTSISLSDDVLSVQPVNDDSVGSLLVKSQGGSYILAVDTTNSKVLVGASQVAANTQYQRFSVVNHTPATNTHYPLGMSFADFSSIGLSEDTILGTGTDPATTLDISAATSESHAWVNYYWYLPDAITLDSATISMATNNATDVALNFHIMSYAVDTSSNYGDLSDGTVVADSGTTSAVDEDVIKIATMTIQSANVAAGRVLIATFESDGVQTTSLQMLVKYHIQ